MIYNVLGKNELEFLNKIIHVEQAILDLYKKLAKIEFQGNKNGTEYSSLLHNLKKLVEIEASIFKINNKIDLESIHDYLNQNMINAENDDIYIYSRLIEKINLLDDDIYSNAFFIDNARNEMIYFQKYIEQEIDLNKKESLCDTKYLSIYTKVTNEIDLINNSLEASNAFYDSEDFVSEYRGINKNQYELFKEFQVSTSLNEVIKMFMLPDNYFKDNANYSRIIRSLCLIKAILLKANDYLFDTYYKAICQVASTTDKQTIKMLKDAFDEVKEDKKSIVKVHFF